jgi:hypothetical protein
VGAHAITANKGPVVHGIGNCRRWRPPTADDSCLRQP